MLLSNFCDRRASVSVVGASTPRSIFESCPWLIPRYSARSSCSIPARNSQTRAPMAFRSAAGFLRFAIRESLDTKAVFLLEYAVRNTTVAGGIEMLRAKQHQLLCFLPLHCPSLYPNHAKPKFLPLRALLAQAQQLAVWPEVSRPHTDSARSLPKFIDTRSHTSRVHQ